MNRVDEFKLISSNCLSRYTFKNRYAVHSPVLNLTIGLYFRILYNYINLFEHLELSSSFPSIQKVSTSDFCPICFWR